MVFSKYGCRALGALTAFFGLGVGNMSAQSEWNPAISTSPTCVINKTSFETATPLCNPDLPNDTTGWFSDNLGNLFDFTNCGETQGNVYNVLQEGIQATISSPSKLFDAKSWKNCLSYQNGTDAGMTAIMACPKLIDPMLYEGNGSNMLVNAGTYQDGGDYFLSYSLTGLKPNSRVEMSLDCYYLLDEESTSICSYCNNKVDDIS